MSLHWLDLILCFFTYLIMIGLTYYWFTHNRGGEKDQGGDGGLPIPNDPQLDLPPGICLPNDPKGSTPHPRQPVEILS